MSEDQEQIIVDAGLSMADLGCLFIVGLSSVAIGIPLGLYISVRVLALF